MHSGYLMKRSDHLLHWRSRWVVIGEAHCLATYKERGVARPTALLRPDSVRLCSKSSEGEEKSYCFVVTGGSGKGAESLFLSTDTEASRQLWVEQITLCIGALKSRGPDL